MTETYYSGDYYLTISNEMPVTNDGNTYCMFDLTREKNSRWGCPVNQFGSIEEIIDTLKGWQKIDEKPEFDCVREINKSVITMESEFISILENKLNEKVI